MNRIICLFLLLVLLNCTKKAPELATSNWKLSTLKDLPEAITNNAVIEGFINGEPYAFSFAGLDSTKVYSGIHLRSYRYNVKEDSWLQIADLPDTLGKIASAASRVKDTIYIIGGYHVFEDHTERSSNKVHRYVVKENRFLEDATAIPIPIDDQVQAVWRDSLIYVVTGWSDTENQNSVQIYNPTLNSWQVGESVPDNHTYKSFGASGVIVADTIFYFGGASMGKHYPIQNVLRKGIIDPKDPTKIEWSYAVLDSTIVGYRMAATVVNNHPHWIGGSTITYNYNPEAYNGSGGVSPEYRDLAYQNGELKPAKTSKTPMDLRGIAVLNDSMRILIGGIEDQQKVSKKVYLLKWKE